MRNSLVGYTGFVGSNLLKSNAFTDLYNSQNINDAFGIQPDLLVYAGVRAEKFLANKEPEKDLEIVKTALNNIQRIKPKKLVLISTVDVYDRPLNVNENSVVNELNEQAYGRNRYILEKMVRSEFNDTLIIRLPALFGENLKKNFIFDMVNLIPTMLPKMKFEELSIAENVKQYYDLQGNGFYKLKDIDLITRKKLKSIFEVSEFSALNFTDSRGSFQFYNLSNLWEHINIALENGIKLLNIATEPITASEIFKEVTGRDFVNEISDYPPCYDCRTIHDELFNGRDGYIQGKKDVLIEVKEFVKRYTK